MQAESAAVPAGEVLTRSPEETQALARAFAARLKPGDVVLLYGDLGAGKTCFTAGLASAFGIPERAVSSPTFAIMNRYDGTIPLFHFDLYRLKNAGEARDAGLEDCLDAGGICLVEWPEKAGALLSPPVWIVELRHADAGLRTVRITEKRA